MTQSIVRQGKTNKAGFGNQYALSFARPRRDGRSGNSKKCWQRALCVVTSLFRAKLLVACQRRYRGAALKMDCGTARALKTWVDRSAKPALSRKGGGLKQIKVAAHYACRRRNNSKTGKISEHGKGRAIDISGFRLADGSEISVLKGWNARSSRKALRKMHADACGPFGTVLGPKSNRFHLDHFHFDTARYRSGSYCR
jgi:hypothetical protein